MKCLSKAYVMSYAYDEVCIACTEQNLLAAVALADSATKIAEMGKVKRGKA